MTPETTEKIAEIVRSQLGKTPYIIVSRVFKMGNRYAIYIPAKHREIGEKLHGKHVHVVLIPLE